MKRIFFVLIIFLSISLIFSCGKKTDDQSETISKLKQEIVELKATITKLEAELVLARTPKEPLKIGVLVPLTGIVAQGGLEMKYGIEMAAEEKGTVLGRPIELLVEDTQVKPPVAVTKAEKLVYKDDCKALIGVFSSGVGLALAKNIDKLNVPFVSTHVMTTKFYGLHPLVFRSGQLANDQTAVGNVKGIMARPDLMKRSYYVIVHDYSWGHDAGERFIALAKENGIKIVNEDYDKAPIATKDWSSYISKIKASGADAVYMAFITNVIPVFAKQASDFGLQGKVKLVSAAAPGPLELEAGGEACYGIFGASDWSWDVDNANSNDWEMRFWKKFNTIPSDAAVHSYVGAMNLFNAIEKAGSTDAKAIADALRGISFDGPYGNVRISAKDNCMRNSAVLTETMAAPENPFGAKVYMKVLKTFTADELGPPE
ncbi:MAG: ABC transporter substrate-binding protein [Deltaproteobacteria bacterium]|uniref:ABC transporter substrate-binding protein n=1 Tax=Desulfobacula sp. TaxID=2593537 RepID=UPI0019B34073|nr:ABC transporter substrate-binding protein [Candidatus Desulfobacula maris]MBL6993361.1 ABC transporter substrate-binding protein [Desulfobacula sp.]